MDRDLLDATQAHRSPHRAPRWLAALLALAALPGCVEQAYKDSIAQFPPPAESESGSSSSTGPATPTTGDSATDPEVQTLTGPDDGTASTAGPNGEPPNIELFDVTPKHLAEAGPAELQLLASADVIKVQLTLDSKPLGAIVTLAAFPQLWEALSAKDNGAARIFGVLVEDDEGLTDYAETTLSVQLPPSGAEKCIFIAPDAGAGTSVIAALEYTHDWIYAVGSHDTGLGLRLAAWKLDPNTCKLAAGWPKSLVNWSTDDALAGLTSSGSAVDVDAAGNLVVAGNLTIGGVPQSYVALLTPDGARLWEQAGQLGDEVSGVAAAGELEDRVLVVGSRRTANNPVRTDGAIWVYKAVNNVVVVPLPTILKAPFTAEEPGDPGNERSERLRAVVIHPDAGNVLAVGEREASSDLGEPPTRAFAVQIEPADGTVSTSWTSWGPALAHDAARSLAVCGDRFVTGGWTRADDPNAKAEPMLLWIDADGTSSAHRHFPELDATEINGVACDRELKIVSAGARSTGEPDTQVFTVQTQLDTPIWYEDGVGGDDGAGTVACDPRGFCAWGGYRTMGGKPHAVVRVHHP